MLEGKKKEEREEKYGVWGGARVLPIYCCRSSFISNSDTLTGEPPLEIEIHGSSTLVLFILINYYYYLFVIN